MKRRLLVIALCLVCMASFAQTKKKPAGKSATKGKGTSASSKKPAVVTNIDSSKLVPSTSVASAVPAQTKKALVPVKPFDRPLDGYYKKNNILNAKVVPMPVLREADVVFEHRVWRDIDLRERFNEYMASPKGRLIDVILEAVGRGELTAYDPTPNPDPNAKDPDGDAFSAVLTSEGAVAKMVDTVTVNIVDPKTGEKTTKLVPNIFNPDSVVRFRIKEDYIFDKQRSVTEWRIIGIAPLVKHKVEGAGNLDYQPAFWIYFPDARKVFATKEVVNKKNDATGLSYDDVFMKRMFIGYITKESNDKDEKIKDYAQGFDRLYESERIKKSLLDWELTLWQY